MPAHNITGCPFTNWAACIYSNILLLKQDIHHPQTQLVYVEQSSLSGHYLAHYTDALISVFNILRPAGNKLDVYAYLLYRNR